MKSLLIQLLTNRSSLAAVNLRKGFKNLSNKEKTEYAEFLYDCFKYLSINFHNLFGDQNKLNLSQHQAYCVINNLFRKTTYRALYLNVPDIKMFKRRTDLSSLNTTETYKEKEEIETIIKAFQDLLEYLAYGRQYSEKEITYPIMLGVIKLLRLAVNFEAKARAKKFTGEPLTLGLPVFSGLESATTNGFGKSSVSFASVYPSELKAVTSKTAFGG